MFLTFTLFESNVNTLFYQYGVTLAFASYMTRLQTSNFLLEHLNIDNGQFKEVEGEQDRLRKSEV